MHKPAPLSEEELNQLFTKGCEDCQKGLLDSAKSCFLQLLEYFPQAPVLHYNLGLVYYEKGEYESGCTSFVKAASCNPEDMDILFNLALCQKKGGDLEGAVDSYKKVLQNDSKSIDSLYNLAGCYKDSRQDALAIETYLEVLKLVPDHSSAINNLAYVYHCSGESERAIHYYKMVLEANPDHQAAKHMLASLGGTSVTTSPESYIKEVFDNYSGKYERSLVTELEYSVPTTIRKLLDQRSGWKKHYDHGLDLGCGTGLSGQPFADMVVVLDGIDLSEKMMALAAEKNIYQHLYSGSFQNFLRSTEEKYDFFLAADVFAYVGDLEETFLLLRQCGRRDVLFCFSTENFFGAGYHLQQTGRFSHSLSYVEEVAGATGWEVVKRYPTSLRKEKGEWVQGDIWFLVFSGNGDGR